MSTSYGALFSILASFATSTVALAAPAAPTVKSAAAAAAAAAAPVAGKKTTDVSFEDVLVQGKYHFSDESVTTVENDKVLDALLGVRTDFKDRLKKSAARH